MLFNIAENMKKMGGGHQEPAKAVEATVGTSYVQHILVSVIRK